MRTERGYCGVVIGTRAAFTKSCFPVKPDCFPQESTPRSHITHCSSPQGAHGRGWRIGKKNFSAEVEFPTFSEMIFQFLVFAPLFPANDSWCFQTELNTSFEPWMVS